MFHNSEYRRYNGSIQYSTPAAFRKFSVSSCYKPTKTGDKYHEETPPRVRITDIATVRAIVAESKPTRNFVDVSTNLAFEQGRLAGLRGQGFRSNPYKKSEDCISYNAWVEGFETS